MTVGSIFEIFVRLVGLAYRWFEQYVFNYFVNLGRGFEQVFAMIAVATFLLITVFLLIRRLKKLQKYYVIQIIDNFGRNIILEDLRLTFSRYDVAKSYLQFYEALYEGQYRFRVTQFIEIASEKPNTRGGLSINKEN
jgi:hypothetical protein